MSICCCCCSLLQVLGNMKGVIAAGISIALFKNPVTAKGMFGYFITVCGVVAYSEVCGTHVDLAGGPCCIWFQ